jgi:putative CocE/NonD family hydrolase
LRIRTDFPRTVRELTNVWIPLSDGCRLAGRIWLPEDAEDDPVPAILEYIPYRKNDWTAPRDSVRHPWFAGHGYAAVRIDLRGTGDSDGILLDEYLLQEQDDALEVISWIASQPWCTGEVGMIGISWGGFNGLQVAARRPAELKAVVTICSTDDRYADDVHYAGGCVLAIDMLPWASHMLVWNATPPDPEIVGEAWRETWRDRLEWTPPFVEAWLSHQRRDAYWKHGSVCEDFASIECPVFAVGGWADGYSNAVLRLLAGLSCPRKGLIGPWAHAWPEDAFPGPSIGFLQECMRFFDCSLKGAENGFMEEELLRVWMEEWTPGSAHVAERPGRWLREDAWPSPRVVPRELSLNGGSLDAVPGPEHEIRIRSPQALGLDSGLWCPYGDAADMATDQRFDDALSAVFDTEPLDERVEILGFPEVRLELAADRPAALAAVRLCDVAPGGESSLVTRGFFNLTHRESHEEPAPLAPGRRYSVAVPLNAIAHAFQAGHRIRLAVSSCYWPMLWPSPEQVTLSLFAGASRLVLPVRAAGATGQDPPLRAFDTPEQSPPLPVVTLVAGSVARTITREVASGRVELVYAYGDGRRRLPNGIELEDSSRETFTIVEGDPLSATVETAMGVSLGRNGWRTRIETKSTMRSDAVAFHVTNELTAYEGGQLVFARTWTFDIPRDLV